MKKALLGLGLLVMVLPVACQQLGKKVSDGDSENWPHQMQSLGEGLKEMIPLVYDRKEFAKPSNEEKIRKQMKSFSRNVHKLSPQDSKKLVGEDPLFTFTLNRFQGDLKRATKSFNSGHKEYSRSLAKSFMSHCIYCHTRNAVGPEFKGDWLDGLKLSRLEKADLLVASRHYDEALATLERILDESKESRDFPFEVERALRRYLSLMVRVKRSPDRAIVKLESFLERAAVPYYLIEHTRKWKKSLKKWSVSLKNKKAIKDPLAEAKEMIRLARRTQEYRKDHSADVEYLIATTILHDGLITMKGASQLSQAYFLLGNSYVSLGDMVGQWGLHEFYFEACVREWPRGPLARKCYERVEESVFVGYSGSSGVHIPYHEKMRLNELKNLIFVDPM